MSVLVVCKIVQYFDDLATLLSAAFKFFGDIKVSWFMLLTVAAGCCHRSHSLRNKKILRNRLKAAATRLMRRNLLKFQSRLVGYWIWTMRWLLFIFL